TGSSATSCGRCWLQARCRLTPPIRPTSRKSPRRKRNCCTAKAARAPARNPDFRTPARNFGQTSIQGNPSPQGQPESYSLQNGGIAVMSEKIKKLDLQRDYKKFLYFIDGEGSVCHKPKSGGGESKVLLKHAVERDNQYLYF